MKKALILLISIVLFACNAEQKEATLVIGITDAPITSAESVVVTFTKIEIAKEDAADSEWETYFEGEQDVDLLDFQNGNVFDFPDKVLDAGDYGQVRLFLSSTEGDNTITIDSTTYNLAYNSGVANNGLKLVGGFTLEEGVTTELTIDFDARKSIVVKGGKNPSYNLKPTIKLIQTNTAGNIKISNATADETYYLYLSTTDVTDQEDTLNEDDEAVPYFGAKTSAIGVTEDDSTTVTFAFVPFETYKVYVGSYDVDGNAQPLELLNISDNDTETVSISESDDSTVNFTFE